MESPPGEGRQQMQRKLACATVVLVVLGVMPSAFATKPIREVHPDQRDVVITGQCGFPVGGHIDGREIVTTFTDADGNPVKQIVTFPANRLTLTNLRSGTEVTVMSTGSSQLRARSDGSTIARAMGHGVFFPNPITGEPGLWYLSGKGTAVLDADGNETSSSLAGRLVDLCASLA
jgi:hypothetical protein